MLSFEGLARAAAAAATAVAAAAALLLLLDALRAAVRLCFVPAAAAAAARAAATAAAALLAIGFVAGGSSPSVSALLFSAWCTRLHLSSSCATSWLLLSKWDSHDVSAPFKPAASLRFSRFGDALQTAGASMCTPSFSSLAFSCSKSTLSPIPAEFSYTTALIIRLRCPNRHIASFRLGLRPIHSHQQDPSTVNSVHASCSF